MDSQITLSVAEGRRVRERELARRREELEQDEEHLAQLKARDDPPAPPKAKPTCWICGEEVRSGRNMGITGLISSKTVLAHAPTGQGAGCWTVLQRARSVILPKCKVGPKRHDVGLGDKLLREEVDRMLTMPKYQAEVDGQWDPSYHLTAKTGEAVRLDRIESELKELRQRSRGGQTGNAQAQAADLATATEAVDERERLKYVDGDIEFKESPASKENYPGEHHTENNQN